MSAWYNIGMDAVVVFTVLSVLLVARGIRKQ